MKIVLPVLVCFCLCCATVAWAADSTPASSPSTAPATAPVDKPELQWTRITDGLGGDKWGGGGVTLVVSVPGSGTIIAAVSEAGLWASDDDGKSWHRLGEKDAVPIRNHPYQIVFDPKDAARFWESGSGGPGLFRTDDGGQSFHRLGDLENTAGIGIDFSDPARKTLIAGFAQEERSIVKSVDGGGAWTKIGQNLPDKTNISSDVIVLGPNTYLVNAAGWKRQGADLLGFGIFRTEDGGTTFAKVSDAGPSGPALVASDGAIYWQALWNKGLLKSTDAGKTWQALGGPVLVNPIELPGGKLLAPVENTLHLSADGGKTWQRFGTPLPFKPSGVCFNAKNRALYAWRSTDAKEDNVIVRSELP